MMLVLQETDERGHLKESIKVKLLSRAGLPDFN
jgi:hypothetical protein